MIETFEVELEGGIRLACRASGREGAPVLLFLHGFPEAAFVWDALLERFGDRYRCIAPNLRGFAPSSSPTAVEAYRLKHLVADIDRLIDRLGGGPLAALVAHDWGGAVAWSYAAVKPDRLQRLVIVNSPHPATFLRELRDNPAQRAASAYMNFLCRPDAEALLTANDHARLWALFESIGATDGGAAGGSWLTEALREQYRGVWRGGLTGGCNYYRASPLRPPTPENRAVETLVFDPRLVTVNVPTLVIWGERDRALPPALVDGLDAFVPSLRLVRVPEATHWIVHEQPVRVGDEIERHLATAVG